MPINKHRFIKSQLLSVASPCSGGDICGKNCRIKIAPKHRNYGDAKFFLIFCRKKQRTNAKSEWSKGRGLAICRRRKIYVIIGVELIPFG